MRLQLTRLLLHRSQRRLQSANLGNQVGTLYLRHTVRDSLQVAAKRVARLIDRLQMCLKRGEGRGLHADSLSLRSLTLQNVELALNTRHLLREQRQTAASLQLSLNRLHASVDGRHVILRVVEITTQSSQVVLKVVHVLLHGNQVAAHCRHVSSHIVHIRLQRHETLLHLGCGSSGGLLQRHQRVIQRVLQRRCTGVHLVLQRRHIVLQIVHPHFHVIRAFRRHLHAQL